MNTITRQPLNADTIAALAIADATYEEVRTNDGDAVSNGSHRDGGESLRLALADLAGAYERITQDGPILILSNSTNGRTLYLIPITLGYRFEERDNEHVRAAVALLKRHGFASLRWRGVQPGEAGFQVTADPREPRTVLVSYYSESDNESRWQRLAKTLERAGWAVSGTDDGTGEITATRPAGA